MKSKPTIKTVEHKVERKSTSNTTVDNDTVNNVNDLINVLKYHAINECFLV